jgi:hypothetical protein
MLLIVLPIYSRYLAPAHARPFFPLAPALPAGGAALETLRVLFISAGESFLPIFSAAAGMTSPPRVGFRPGLRLRPVFIAARFLVGEVLTIDPLELFAGIRGFRSVELMTGSKILRASAS